MNGCVSRMISGSKRRCSSRTCFVASPPALHHYRQQVGDLACRHTAIRPAAQLIRHELARRPAEDRLDLVADQLVDLGDMPWAGRAFLFGMLKRVNESLKSRCKALLCLVATVHIDFHRKTVLADSIPPCQPG